MSSTGTGNQIPIITILKVILKNSFDIKDRRQESLYAE